MEPIIELSDLEGPREAGVFVSYELAHALGLGYRDLGRQRADGDLRRQAAGCGGADELATGVGLRVSDSGGNPVGP